MKLKLSKLIILCSWACLGLIGTVAADELPETELQRFHSAKIAEIQAQIDSLYEAVALLQMQTLTEQEKFELIGEPSFQAVDNALSEHGFTLQSLHEFESLYQTQIDTWKAANIEHQNLYTSLEYEKDSLLNSYDQLIKPVEVTE